MVFAFLSTFFELNFVRAPRFPIYSLRVQSQTYAAMASSATKQALSECVPIIAMGAKAVDRSRAVVALVFERTMRIEYADSWDGRFNGRQLAANVIQRLTHEACEHVGQSVMALVQVGTMGNVLKLDYCGLDECRQSLENVESASRIRSATHDAESSGSMSSASDKDTALAPETVGRDVGAAESAEREPAPTESAKREPVAAASSADTDEVRSTPADGSGLPVEPLS